MFVLVAVLAFFPALELALRAAGVGQQRYRFEDEFPHLVGKPFLTGHPQRVFTVAARTRTSPEHAGRYANGDWPFRGRPPQPGPADVVRVVVLGESIAFGAGVDAAETLAHQTALELARRGLPQDRVQVLNMAVPAYSVVQVRELLREVLDELAPAAVVLHVGTFVDQKAAVAANDVELVELRSGLTGFVRQLALAAAFEPLVRRLAPPSTLGPSRPRVPEPYFAECLEQVLAACRAAGARPLVIASAHTAQMAEDAPRTRRDAATCLTVARRLGVDAIDAQELLRSQGLPEEQLFVDSLHLSPPALEILGHAVGERLAAHLASLPGPAPHAAEAGTLEVTPDEVSTLGDQRVTLRARGFSWPRGPFVLCAGNALVLDLREEGPDAWSGLLPANAAGTHEVLLQSAEGCRVFPAAVRYRAPELTVDAAQRVRVRARPGDRVFVFGAAALHARWTEQGRIDLDREHAFGHPVELTCDASGLAEHELTAHDLAGHGVSDEDVFLQALVLPHGANDPAEPLGRQPGRYTNVARLGGAPASEKTRSR